MQSRIEKHIFSAIDEFNAKRRFQAYSLFNQALQEIKQEKNPNPKDRLYCQLSLLRCKIETGLIDVTKAKKTLKQLHDIDKAISSPHEETIKELTKILTNLDKEKNLADYKYVYAQHVAETINAINAINDGVYTRDSDQAIIMSILSLDPKNVLDQIHILEKAIDACEYASNVYYQLSLHKSIKSANLIMASLHETLADKHVDYADELTQSEEKIRMLKRAYDHYNMAINLITNTASTQHENANQSIWLELSRLETLEKLTKLDNDQSDYYVNEMKKYLNDKAFQEKLTWVNDDHDEIQRLLALHRDFCEEHASRHKKRKHAISASDSEATEIDAKEHTKTKKEKEDHNSKKTKNAEIELATTTTLLPQDDSNMAISTEQPSPVFESEFNAGEADEVMTYSSTNSNPIPPIEENQKIAPTPSPFKSGATLFSTPIGLQKPHSESAEIKNKHVKDSFKFVINHLVESFGNAFDPFHMSEILREIARFHRKKFDQFHKNEAMLAELTQSLYEKSQALHQNERAYKELSKFQNEKMDYLHNASQPSDKTKFSYKTTSNQMERRTFFFNAIEEYIDRLINAYPKDSNKIIADLFDHLRRTNDLIEHIKTSDKNKLEIISILVDGKKLINNPASEVTSRMRLT